MLGIPEQYKDIFWLIVLISSLGKSFLGRSDEIIMFAVGNFSWAFIATAFSDSATSSLLDLRLFVPVWIMMFWGSFRVDGQRVLRAASVVGHQNLATLCVGKSFKGSMYRPLESRSRAVFVGLGDRVAIEEAREVWPEAVDRDGSAGEVVPGEGGGPAAGVHIVDAGVAGVVGRADGSVAGELVAAGRPGAGGSGVGSVLGITEDIGRAGGVAVNVGSGGPGKVVSAFGVGVIDEVGKGRGAAGGVDWVGEVGGLGGLVVRHSDCGAIGMSRLLSVCEPVDVACSSFGAVRVLSLVSCFERLLIMLSFCSRDTFNSISSVFKVLLHFFRLSILNSRFFSFSLFSSLKFLNSSFSSLMTSLSISLLSLISVISISTKVRHSWILCTDTAVLGVRGE